MALSLNKIPLANVATNTAGAFFQTVTVSNVGSGNSTSMNNAQFIPAGLYQALPQANVVFEFNTFTAGANSWATMIANNTAGIFLSDGFNVRANAVTGTQTVTLYTVNGGQAVTNTFIS